MFNKKEMRQWRKENRKKLREYHKQYCEEHPEEILEYRRQYRIKHHRQIRKRENNERRTNLKCNLNHRINVMMNESLKGNKKGRHWENLISYDLNTLIKHLKLTIPKGYTWQDYLEGKLHIDHIFPISIFNFNKPEDYDFKRCWALKNLRLLPVKENLIKNAKLIKPFQPALDLSG